MMKNFFYLLVLTISACSPNNDYFPLEDKSPLDASIESVNLESELNFNQSSPNVFNAETFENVDLTYDPSLSDFYPELVSVDHSFALDDNVKRFGNFSGRFEINRTDPSLWGGNRAEMAQYMNSTLDEGWYGFSQYFPDSYTNDSTEEVVGQWHDQPDAGETASRSPSNAIITGNNRLKWMIRWDSRSIMTDNLPEGQIYLDLGEIPKNKWIDWVVHIKFSNTNTGILEVWMDGVKVIDRQNLPNSYNDEKYPYFKFGIYKWDWGNVTNRRVYYDEVRVGNKYSSYEEVSANRINMMVNSHTVDCFGEMEGTCLLVQEGEMIGTETWKKFYYYNGIEGFTYEPGFVYGLLVKKTELENPQAGGSSLKYELVKIISKEMVGDSEEQLPQNSEPSESVPSEPEQPGNREWAHNKRIRKN